jgi:peptidoglycan/LPS O-acetylase OafA/YrhL
MKSMHWPLLGLARFLLALIVAGSHLASFAPKGDPTAFIAQFSGLVAVMGFLVISGYSIAASYERETHDFYFRRALRILPQYVLLVVASALLPVVFSGSLAFAGQTLPAPAYSQVVLNLCFAEGFFTGSIETNPVVWTLALEVFFYAVTPLLARCSNRTLLLLGTFGALCYVNVPAFFPIHFPTALWGINVVLLGWAWVLGFWMQRAKGSALEIAWAIGVFALTLNHAGIEKWWLFTFSLPLLALKIAPRLRPNERLARWFLFLGDISYPLYLVHFPLYLVWTRHGFETPGVVLLVGAIAVSSVLDLAYDKPVKRLIRRARDRWVTRGGLAVSRAGAPESAN